MITIVLADDHPIVRQGLKELLKAEHDLQVVGEAGDGLEAAKLGEALQPNVMVLDLMLGGINGIEVTRRLAKRAPKTNVVILSMHSNEAYVVEALQAGAKAYVLKESTAEELVHAVREVSSGHRYLSRALSERAIDAYLYQTKNVGTDPYDTLTVREQEVFCLAAQGYTNAEIASKLVISRRTVESHRANIMQKLGLHTQTDLIRYAIKRGILPSE